MADDRPRWLEQRRGGVAATDIVTILGLSRHASLYSLYQDKTGHGEERPDNGRLRLGRDLEPLIVARWQETAADPCLIPDAGGLYRSSARPWQLATPDRIIMRDTDHVTETRAAVLECKSWADADRHAWDDNPPVAVRAQLLWQMDVLGVPLGIVTVLFLPSGESAVFEVRHGDCIAGSCEVCEDQSLMIRAGHEFWESVLQRKAPSPDGSAATLAALRSRYPVNPDSEAEIDPNLIIALGRNRACIRAYKAEAAKIEAKIREQAGDARVLTVGGEKAGVRVAFSADVKAHVRRTDYIRLSDHGDDDE